jgi:putative transposase
MAGIAVSIDLSPVERELLQKLLRSRRLGKDIQIRVQIVLAAADLLTNRQIEKDYGIEVHRVGTWRNRFHEAHELWKRLDADLRPPMNKKLLLSWLADRPGRGRKATITKEQKALITALACKPPSESGYPHTHWTLRLLTQEVLKRGIVPSIVFQTVGAFLKSGQIATAQERLLVKRQG